MSEQVICVDDSNQFIGGDDVVKGEIYTIRRTAHDGKAVFLNEVYAQLNDGQEIPYWARRFAPIKDESLEIFRAMDRKIFNKKKVTA